MIEWYYAEGDARRGPVSESEFNRLVDLGQITGNTLVWNTEMGDQWVSYGAIGGEVATGSDGALGGDYQCVECGSFFAGDEVIDYDGLYVCGGCKGTFFQRLREGGALQGAYEYVGFWIRLVAKFLDGIIVAVVSMVFNIPLSFVMGSAQEDLVVFIPSVLVYVFLNFVLPLVYYVYFHGKFGATPGKMALGIRVVRPDGERITYLRAFGRYFAEFLSGITLYVGYIMAGFDDEKRALHDYVCDTRVVRDR